MKTIGAEAIYETLNIIANKLLMYTRQGTGYPSVFRLKA